MKPKRIQRKRTEGWKMPEGAVYVGPPSKWSNPFKPGKTVSHLLTEHDWALGRYSRMGNYDKFKDRVIDSTLSLQLFAIRSFYNPAWRFSIKKELRGLDLACWCKESDRCHADILLEVANEDSLLAAAAKEGK